MSILQSVAQQSAIDGLTSGREELENRYAHLLEDRFELRREVTYVPSKDTPIQRWFKYKEGFSSTLVRMLLEEFRANPRTDRVFDPFVGSGSTVLTAKQLGYGAWGVDILPVAVFVAQVKLRRAEEYDLADLRRTIDDVLSAPFKTPTLTAPDDVRIVGRAYTEETLEQILFFQEQITAIEGQHIRDFLQLALLSILESVSHTSKDGQYLRLKPDKPIPDVREALRAQLELMWDDLTGMRQPSLLELEPTPTSPAGHCYIEPADARCFADQFDDYADVIITSPPYLNRYDYSRIYSLELCLAFVERFEQLKRVSENSILCRIEEWATTTCSW